jgi:SAM-dependent methyltransferase
MNAYPCGCRNELHEPTGAFHCIAKCPKHRARHRDPVTLDEAYYTELGVLKDGKLAETRHVAELVEALGPLPMAPSQGIVLEVGCGMSPYLPALRKAGWAYTGIDAFFWAAEEMRRRYGGGTAYQGEFEDLTEDATCDLILAAHSFEHMSDAPGAIVKCARLLNPGGELWIVVPDDSDPVNPDHLWFFSPASLRKTVELAGLEVLALETRRIVKHENFIYVRAVKP